MKPPADPNVLYHAVFGVGLADFLAQLAARPWWAKAAKSERARVKLRRAVAQLRDLCDAYLDDPRSSVPSYEPCDRTGCEQCAGRDEEE